MSIDTPLPLDQSGLLLSLLWKRQLQCDFAKVQLPARVGGGWPIDSVSRGLGGVLLIANAANNEICLECDTDNSGGGKLEHFQRVHLFC